MVCVARREITGGAVPRAERRIILAKPTAEYVCSKCGAVQQKWMGQCPKCREWNTLEERQIVRQNGAVQIAGIRPRTQVSAGNPERAHRLGDVCAKKNGRFLTGNSEFDRAVGGGLVNDSVIIISAPPGAGKSTLCLQTADAYAAAGKCVLYASGEESETQIKDRASRLCLGHADDILIMDGTSMDDVCAAAAEYRPSLIVIDSIQAFSLAAFEPSRPGNGVQITECTSAAISVAKGDREHPCAVILIGQMTKDDELAGVRSLEHAADAYFRLDGERDESLRMLTAVKNRFGSTDETGFFRMTEKGLESIENPSEYFMSSREIPVSGTALTVMRQGSRPVIAEIEALTSKSFAAFPSRFGDCVRRDRLNILLSVLEQKAGIPLYDTNVAVGAAGSIKLNDPGSALALIAAVASSAKDTPVPKGTAFLADVSLTGELRKVPEAERSVAELERMGFRQVIVAGDQQISDRKDRKISVVKCRTLADALSAVGMKVSGNAGSGMQGGKAYAKMGAWNERGKGKDRRKADGNSEDGED